MSSVLGDIKSMLGVDTSCDHFDTSIMIHINAALMNLSQLGAVASGTHISGADTTWDEILSSHVDVEAAKTYVYFLTRLGFDPPTNSFVTNSFRNMIDEYAWRIALQVEINPERREIDSG